MSAHRRAALTALDRGRGAVMRLEDPRAQGAWREAIVEAWTSTEVALRAMLGGAAVGGQALVRQVREQGLLTLEQAHQLIDFAAARDRVELDGHEAAPADAEAAVRGYRALDDALNEAAVLELKHRDAPTPQVGAAGAAGAPTVGAPTIAPPPAAVGSRRRRRPSPALTVLIFVLVFVVVPLLGWWYVTSRPGSPRRLQEAVELYRTGDREAARVAFARLADARPDDPVPRVYLGRIARELGDPVAASRELQTAVRLGPGDPLALREMGAFLLASGDPVLARNFYVRAVRANPADTVAMGYLGCTLVRLGRMDEAQNWFRRAGPGEWERCLVAPPPMAPGMPGMPPAAPAL